MPVWFWGWLVTAALIAIVAAVTRDRLAAPWAVGALVAAGLSAIGTDPVWHWVAFLGVSSVLFVALNRARYVARHSAGSRKRPPGGDGS